MKIPVLFITGQTVKNQESGAFLDVKYSENIHCEFSVTDTVKASSTNFGNSDGS